MHKIYQGAESKNKKATIKSSAIFFGYFNILKILIIFPKIFSQRFVALSQRTFVKKKKNMIRQMLEAKTKM